MGLGDTAVNFPVPQRILCLPVSRMAGNLKLQRLNPLPGSIHRQKGKREIVPADRGGIAGPQAILKGKLFDTIPLFYTVIRCRSRLRRFS